MSISNPFSQVERIQLEELSGWRVTTARAELLVAEQGAQVLSYRRFGEPPLIWLSDQARYLRGQGVRGGVPVCWPWFGDLQRNPPAVQTMVQGAAPFHGLARTLDWQLQEVREQADAVELALVLELDFLVVDAARADDRAIRLQHLLAGQAAE